MSRLSVKRENATGLNTLFHDKYTKEDMTRLQAVKKVENGLYPKYHIRKQKSTGIKFIASNPDRSKNNNLE